MYIRRKVFSVVEDDYTGEERLYSTYDVDYLGDEYYDEYGEKMYSDFDDELDDRYYSDYEGEKLFFFDKYGNAFTPEQANMKSYKAALKDSNAHSKESLELEKAFDKNREEHLKKAKKVVEDQLKKKRAELSKEKDPKTIKRLQKEVAFFENQLAKIGKSSARQAVLRNQGKGSFAAMEGAAAKDFEKQAFDASLKGRAINGWNGLSKNKKIAAVAVPVAALGAAGGAYAYSRRNK